MMSSAFLCQAASSFFFASGALNGTRAAGMAQCGVKCTAAVCMAGSITRTIVQAAAKPGTTAELSEEKKKQALETAKEARTQLQELAKSKDVDASYLEWLEQHADHMESQAKNGIKQPASSPSHKLRKAAKRLSADLSGVGAMALLFKIVNSSSLYFNAGAAALLVSTSILWGRRVLQDADSQHFTRFGTTWNTRHSRSQKTLSNEVKMTEFSLEEALDKQKLFIPVTVAMQLALTSLTGAVAGFGAAYATIKFSPASAAAGTVNP